MSPSTSTSLTTLTCLCGAFTLPGALLKSGTLPIESEICHCNPCRRTTGCLGGTFARLTEPPPTSILAELTAYQSSENTIRFFCSTCGGGQVFHVQTAGTWSCGTGVVERPVVSLGEDPGPDTVKVTRHDYVLDTSDGGTVGMMRTLGGRQIPCYAEGREQGGPLNDAEVQKVLNASTSTSRAKMLPARCQCETISFALTPPDPKKEYNPIALRSLRGDKTKFAGQFCGCRSDRLASGMQMMPWVDPPAEHLVDVTTGEKLDTRQLQGLKRYQSTAEVTRSFCATCGACVFYESDQRPEIVSVAAGLLRDDKGVMAGDWIEWDRQISHVDELRDSELVDAVGQV